VTVREAAARGSLKGFRSLGLLHVAAGEPIGQIPGHLPSSQLHSIAAASV